MLERAVKVLAEKWNKMIGVFRPWLCTVKLYWAGDNLGECCYEFCTWHRIDRLTCWPVVQLATTVPCVGREKRIGDLLASLLILYFCFNCLTVFYKVVLTGHCELNGREVLWSLILGEGGGEWGLGRGWRGGGWSRGWRGIGHAVDFYIGGGGGNGELGAGGQGWKRRVEVSRVWGEEQRWSGVR